MKNLFKIFLALVIVSFAVSCRQDDAVVTPKTNALAGFTKAKEFSNSTHIIELYTPTGTTPQGYNDVAVKIKDKSTGKYVENATINWKPMMHMKSMMHSCPKSELKKSTEDNSVFEGYLVFTMAENDSEYWYLTFDYTIDGKAYTVKDRLSVPAMSKRVVSTFTGSDNVRYILAYIQPRSPQVAINDITIGVWKTESMNSYPVVNNLKVKIDPRMPSMNNHSSPNNADAIQTGADVFYHGKLSLTMTGYWKINLQLLDASGKVLKGEAVTEANPSSSIFFETEF